MNGSDHHRPWRKHASLLWKSGRGLLLAGYWLATYSRKQLATHTEMPLKRWSRDCCMGLLFFSTGAVNAVGFRQRGRALLLLLLPPPELEKLLEQRGALLLQAAAPHLDVRVEGVRPDGLDGLRRCRRR